MLDIFRGKRSKPKRIHLSESDEDASSALISQPETTGADGYAVSETYVVPDINGAFPTDLSDSDDDFFEKKCEHCGVNQSVLLPCNCTDLTDDAEDTTRGTVHPRKPRSNNTTTISTTTTTSTTTITSKTKPLTTTEKTSAPVYTANSAVPSSCPTSQLSKTGALRDVAVETAHVSDSVTT